MWDLAVRKFIRLLDGFVVRDPIKSGRSGARSPISVVSHASNEQCVL